MSDVAIRVEGLGKRYRIGRLETRYKTLRESLAAAAMAPIRRLRAIAAGDLVRRESETVWALSDVSFEVRRGEVLGIIGRNGAGKSTLLKILARITEPTTGRAELRGRVGSLLEVGTGFHPELSGRENIYLNGAILGMRKAEIDRRFDEIVAFAEIERFLDTPVKRYSSGMYVRLAFAVAAHMGSEILLIDEVLAVGDAAFQKKCLDKMGEVTHGGRTVLFVSHNMSTIESLCPNVMVLRDGRVTTHGSCAVAIEAYLGSLARPPSSELSNRLDRKGAGDVRFERVDFLDGEGRPISSAVSGSPLVIRLHFACDAPARGRVARFSISVWRLGKLFFITSTDMTCRDEVVITRSGFIDCKVDVLPLCPGSYNLNVYCESGGEIQDWMTEAVQLSVGSGDFFGTGRNAPPGLDGQCVLVHHQWSLGSESDGRSA